MFGFKKGQKISCKHGDGKVVGFDNSEYCIKVVLDSDPKTIWFCRREELKKK